MKKSSQKKKTEVEKALYKKISRREFIKKAAIGVGAVCIGGYAVSQLLKSPTTSSTFKNDAPATLWKWSKEAYHYTKLGSSNVQCQVCPNRCILEKDDRSVCRVKVNKDGKLYTLAYGNPCAVHVDPIEKKPLYHFLPTTLAFSIATAGCTFRCLNCQNWQISQSKPEQTTNYDLMPDSVVAEAKANSCKSIAYTYSEPTAFYEYMYDSSKLARAEGIKNVWVSNGSMNYDALTDFCQYLDAATIDIKTFDDEVYQKLNGGRLKPVLDALKILKEQKIWLEVSTLIVPEWTDDYEQIKEMSNWIYKNLGADVPFHFLRFAPMYKLTNLPPTPTTTLEKAREIAMDAGMKYVFVGNVPNSSSNNTYCPKCGKILIERKGYQVVQNNIANRTCKFCGESIAGVWA